MKSSKIEQETSYIRAKKRVDNLKGYYTHLMIYVLVNSIISIRKIIGDMDDGFTFEVAIFDGHNFTLWFWWGIGLLFHTYKVFGVTLFFSKDWEERKIKEYMDK